jgi:hypothetical protein
VAFTVATAQSPSGWSIITDQSFFNSPSVPAEAQSIFSLLPLAHEDGKCLLKIFAESYDASFVSSHDNNLSALHVGTREELHYFIRQLRRSVLSCLRSCRRLIQNCRPQFRVVTMNGRSGPASDA